jgi:hypothetical protein
MTPWSYSSIKTFEQCPKKYHHTRVLRDVRDEGGTAALYGKEAHTAAEEFLRDGTPMPGRFQFMEEAVNAFAEFEGDKHVELEMGVKRGEQGFEPCSFSDPDAWWRGIADLVIDQGERAFINDWKTGKNARYADTKQLDLLAGATFLHFPKVKKIKAALTYVVSGDFIQKEHRVELLDSYLGVFNAALEQLEAAHETGVWNAKSSGLCGWCPVEQCPHHRRR